MKEPRAKPSAKIVKLIRVESPYGEGTPEDICRQLTQFFELDGTLVFEIDPKRTMAQVEDALLDAVDTLAKARMQADNNRVLVMRMEKVLKDILGFIPHESTLVPEQRQVISHAADVLKMVEEEKHGPS